MMTQTEMEQLLENIDRRLSSVEQKLPTLATKDDLERFAAKDDLERFATKDDLERFATKDDLERFATKGDLERFATKDELERFATKDELRQGLEDSRRYALMLNEDTRDDIRRVAEGVAGVQQQLTLLARRLEKKGVI